MRGSIVPFALILACAPVVAGAIPTGCPAFTVERPRARVGVTVKAVDFGFSTASDKNATAINRALAKAARVGAVRVELAPGTYRCFDEPGIVIRGFRDFTFDGRDAVLVFRRPAEFRCQPQSELILEKGNLLVSHCERTDVGNLTMDWDWERDPLAAFVRVVAKHVDERDPAQSYVELAFVDYARYPKYPEPVPVQKFMAMDESRARFRKAPGCSCGQTEGHFGAKNAWVAPNRLRLWPGVPMPERNQNPMTGFGANPADNAARVKRFEQGGLYRMQHCYYGKNGINLAANRHLTVHDVTVWSCFGLGMLTDGPQRYWQVANFRVMPPTRAEFAAAYPGVTFRPRPVSSTADGHHVARSQGWCRYVGCRWTLNNDDSSNFHDRFTIAVRGSDTVLDIINRRGAEYFRLACGSEVELRYPNFAPTGFRARAVKIAGNRIWLDRTMPPQRGQCFLVWDCTYRTDHVVMKDCVCEDTGWRNVFSPSDLTIEGCVFRRTAGDPIRFIADYRSNLWCEGMGATNLVVRNCLFEDTNTLVPERAQISTVCVTPTDWQVDPVDPGFVGGGLLVEGCTFRRPKGPVLEFACGADITFRNNTIEVDPAWQATHPAAGTFRVAPAVRGFVETGTRRIGFSAAAK